eukprot:scaffold22994_cov92-Skeletonema_marinoi.AAC.1
MGRWKLSIAIFTVDDTIWLMKELAAIPKWTSSVEDTIWWMKELAAIPKWTSSGHLRRSSTTDM